MQENTNNSSKDAVLAKCPHYYVMEPILGARAGVRPIMNSDTAHVDDEAPPDDDVLIWGRATPMAVLPAGKNDDELIGKNKNNHQWIRKTVHKLNVYKLKVPRK